MKKTHRVSVPLTRLIAALGLLLASTGFAVLVGGSASAGAQVHKSYVCKYVDKPGVGEVLQTGQNPIWVDNDALDGVLNNNKPIVVRVGQQFKDGQVLSVVIVANTAKLDPEPSAADCPSLTPPPPPPTQVTPAAPTFTEPTCANHEVAAIDLPTTTGVTYDVSGTAAPGATVTVTATAQPGYVLTGQTTWTHTFAPADPNGCSQVSPPEVTPPAVTPPKHHPPAQHTPTQRTPVLAPPALVSAPVVTPSIVHAGLAGPPLRPDQRPLGLGLVGTGLALVLGAGGRSLTRRS